MSPPATLSPRWTFTPRASQRQRPAVAGAARFFALLLLALLPACQAPTAAGPPPAPLSVSGLGWLRDRELRGTLERLLGETRGATLSANAVEDAQFLLLAALQAEGFLHPELAVKWLTPEGRTEESILDASQTQVLPRTLQARAVWFRVLPGVRSYVHRVTLSGRKVVPESLARSFFLGETAFFTGKASRAYTPARLARAENGLLAEYRLRGYAGAEVRAVVTSSDPTTGKVELGVTVTEGARWLVGGVSILDAGETGLSPAAGQRFVGQPWTEALRQSLEGEVRTALYARGYADARVRVTHEAGAERDGRRSVTVTAHVRPGEPARLGTVQFAGVTRVRESVLRRTVKVQEGDRLDPLALDRARYRLARLGVFAQVGLRYEPATGPVRHPIFTVREGRTFETSLLVGYGSYEHVRGAAELRHFNLFGRAHQSRLLLAQSMKSTRAEYAYTVPEIFGESVDGTAKIFGLQRDELAFQRQEYGATAALSLPVRALGAHATGSYTLQLLRNRQNELATRTVDDQQVTVASLEAGLTRDRRDNPLRPRLGYRWFARVETASRALGGQAEYQRFEGGGSYHTGWGQGRWVHAALSHGVITTWGTDDRLLPVNKRFFPGGAGSIRGYRDGEASPRGEAGRFVGAKSTMLASLDLEQALTASWSVVVFGDALAAAAAMRDYPLGGDRLVAAGLGLRYQTLIGPLRVEYGRNLNPRPGDPGGTWQIAVGSAF